MKKMLKAVMTGLLVSTMAACSSSAGTTSKADNPAPAAPTAPSDSAAADSSASSKVVDQKELKDPIVTALKYLDMNGFSRQGLIDQMSYDGYEIGRIEIAIKQIGPDWNEQAAKAAKSYLKVQDYTEEELEEQLQKAGFTEDEAAAGAKAAKK